ncbi:FGGY-family carbohydrate kinase [Haploplasma axanthum]|uniref:glycerol kinase n=1 Tax=Haploplasma axanthum TaxID=29552 RepID=A0A449BF12_HAPAX|nr:glycerol kinase GlpK [Haploplasma axanthum]VEU81039.1 Glycerol kinase [Haploplasma axanthum]
MKDYIIAIDQGTTSSKILLINKKNEIVDKDYIEIGKQELPGGEILQNPIEILLSVQELLNRLFERNNLDPKRIDSIAITNQRESTIIWNKKTGKPVYDVISWQAYNTNYLTKEWVKKGYERKVFDKTGLLINPYFSASKIKHILNNTNENIEDLLFGTIDTFLLWNLSVEKNHKTDISNASRTMLFNIHDNKWDKELLEDFEIPEAILPTVSNNNDLFGHYEYQGVKIPIQAMIGDQQSALFGHLCVDNGDVKVTYGTGCFILTNIGDRPCQSKSGLLTTVAWKLDEKVIYALEGSVFMGGSAVRWMRDKLNLVNNVDDSELMAYGSKNDNVYVVPAFVGLGAPYWDNDIKASILGLEANTTKADIMKATLNSIAYQVTDILEIIKKETNTSIKSIAVDGGASNNNYLMQFQSDLINVKLLQNTESEITGLGSAFISGLKTGFFESINEIRKNQKIKKIFIPTSNQKRVVDLYERWKLAVKATQLFK